MKTRLIAAALVLVTAVSACSGDSKPKSLKDMGNVEQLLAPIALYPDQLIAHILMGAQEPAKVTELDKWLKANKSLKGSPLQDAAVKAGFEPSLVALTLFPTVVARMADQISWTTLVGQTFTKDKASVFDAIQRLRKQAADVGTLKTTPQQEVSTKKTSAGSDVIVIEPANPQVVYVPEYKTEVVYTQPPSTTVVVVQEEDNTAEMVAAGMIGFTAGIAIGASMSSPYYYGPYGWHGGGAYMYHEAWDDYYDHREDAREDWMDHREDIVEDRGDRARDRQENTTDRRQNTQEQRTDRQQNRTENRPAAQSAGAQRTERQGSAASRGYGERSASTSSQSAQRSSSSSSSAFSGYSSGSSQRASSTRGQRSVSSSRGGGGRSRGGRQ